MIRAVFFDLDGTLADTALDLGGALNQMLRQEDRPQLAAEQLRPHVSGGARALLKLGFGILPDDPDYPARQQRFLDIYTDRLCQETTLFPGMNELLLNLEQRSILWGIVTNKAQRFTAPLVTGLGLTERSAAIVSGDSAPKAKPAPDTLLLACQQAGVAPGQCIYVGDDLRDVQAGQAAGMGTVIAAWGYLGDGLPIEQWGGDHIVRHPSEILDLLG
ncbi:MAG TPA: HAD-IA family hydrolase [Rhodocyclaceae bacterium]|nr:HAD-IA family hydrolase [Rhodocyclaceae bacterium]